MHLPQPPKLLRIIQPGKVHLPPPVRRPRDIHPKKRAERPPPHLDIILQQLPLPPRHQRPHMLIMPLIRLPPLHSKPARGGRTPPREIVHQPQKRTRRARPTDPAPEQRQRVRRGGVERLFDGQDGGAEGAVEGVGRVARLQDDFRRGVGGDQLGREADTRVVGYGLYGTGGSLARVSPTPTHASSSRPPITRKAIEGT